MGGFSSIDRFISLRKEIISKLKYGQGRLNAVLFLTLLDIGISLLFFNSDCIRLAAVVSERPHTVPYLSFQCRALNSFSLSFLVVKLYIFTSFSMGGLYSAPLALFHFLKTGFAGLFNSAFCALRSSFLFPEFSRI